MIMTPLLLVLLAESTLITVAAAHEQRQHDWRRCLHCPMWFDRHGTTVPKPRWIARFAIHGDGVCPRCAEGTKRPARDERSFAE
jgi:hypothetical protein